MTIEFEKEIDKNPINLSGVKLLSQVDRSFTFLIEIEVSLLLKELSKLPIKDITFPEPDLEDIFLGFYADKVKEQTKYKRRG